jgi:hypothetical protein
VSCLVSQGRPGCIQFTNNYQNEDPEVELLQAVGIANQSVAVPVNEVQPPERTRRLGAIESVGQRRREIPPALGPAQLSA